MNTFRLLFFVVLKSNILNIRLKEMLLLWYVLSEKERVLQVISHVQIVEIANNFLFYVQRKLFYKMISTLCLLKVFGHISSS